MSQSAYLTLATIFCLSGVAIGVVWTIRKDHRFREIKAMPIDTFAEMYAALAAIDQEGRRVPWPMFVAGALIAAGAVDGAVALGL